MKKLFLTLLMGFIVLHCCDNIFSQDTIQEGPVYGTWTTGEYMIMGNIHVPHDSVLNIQPGVTINFQGSYNFIVFGSIRATGAEGDSIVFTTIDPGTNWGGIEIWDQTDPAGFSIFDHCRFERTFTHYISYTVGAIGIYNNSY